ncbi:MAG: hypothetical protein ACRCW4_12085 [Candidatus Neomicrothrix subdominans]|jgi:hypothetical protein
MGSSTSKPRKGHKKPQHLPKVGSPANERWEHDERQQQVFGQSRVTAAIIGVILVLALIGLIFVTL